VSGAPPAADAQRAAERVVAGMLAADAFSRWLGVEVAEVGPRRAVIRMRVRPEMCNGFGICHGGVTFSLADSAFAFACNTHGTVTVAVDNAIAYPAPARAGDLLTATAAAENEPGRVGFYRVTVANQRGEPVAIFRGTAYDTRRPHAFDLPTDPPTDPVAAAPGARPDPLPSSASR
jgi:acyl-CoA thioesterase